MTIHLHGVDFAVVDPIRFNVRLELTLFTIVTLVMAVQVGFHPKSRLHISVAFRFNARSVFPGMVGIFHTHPGDLRLWLDVPGIQRLFAAAKCSRFKGIPTLNRGRHTARIIVVSRTVIGTDAVIKPVIQRPAVNISAGLIRIVLIPGRVQPSAVTADAPIRFITHTITLSITVLISVTCHHAKMPAILRVATPLRQIAA